MLYVAQKERGKRMKSIAFYNNKGGVGKTTSVINISQQLADMEKNVLIVDMDGQGNCSRFFADTPKTGLAQSLITPTSPEIARCNTRYENIDIITSTAELNNIIPTFGAFSDEQQRKQTEKIFSFSAMPWYGGKKYDYLLIDMPPALNALSRNILSSCDFVFVPIELGLFSIQGIPTVTDIISSCGTTFGGCFANRFDKDNPSDLQLLEMLRDNLGKKAMESVIPYSRVIKNSINFSVTAAEYMGWTTASESFRMLTKEILERVGD